MAFPPQLAAIIVDLDGDQFEPFDPASSSVQQRIEFDVARLADLLDLANRRVGSGRVLELGAAPYILTAALAQHGYEVTANALPINGYATTGSLTFKYQNGAERKSALVLFDAEQPYPLEDGEFDLVVAAEIFEHLYRQPWVLLSEAWRLLKPGGLLLMTTPNGQSIDRLINWVRRGPTGMGFNPTMPTGRHAREYNTAEMSAVVDSQGFEVLDVWTNSYSHIGPDGFPGLLGSAKRAIYEWAHRRSTARSGFLHDRGQQIFVAARRTERSPEDPPGFMFYGIGDPRSGQNFAPGTSRDL